MKSNDIQELKELSTSIDKTNVHKFDKVYNEILLPYFKKVAKERKVSKVRITDNMYLHGVGVAW